MYYDILIFIGQLCILFSKKAKKIFWEIKRNIKVYKMDINKVKGMERLWLVLSCINFPLTCHIRNALKIGK